MREKTERDIDILRSEQGELLVTKDFNAKFYKFIVDHYLRKFLFLFAFNTYNHCLWLLNAAQPGESRSHDSGELQASVSGDQLELVRKKGKKFSLLQKLVGKFHRDKRHDGAWILLEVE